jgi:hypothetical protein
MFVLHAPTLSGAVGPSGFSWLVAIVAQRNCGESALEKKRRGGAEGKKGRIDFFFFAREAGATKSEKQTITYTHRTEECARVLDLSLALPQEGHHTRRKNRAPPLSS